jgi:hypothetical protein
MEKAIFIIKQPSDVVLEDFKSVIFDQLLPRLSRLKCSRLKVSLTETPAPKISVIPLKKERLALISVWGLLKKDEKAWKAALESAGGVSFGYEVDESIPVQYEKNWEDGDPSPGFVLLTLLKRKTGMSDEAFIGEWHGNHTPMAIEIHPLWSYIRNVVGRPLDTNGPEFDGIVEEHYLEMRDIFNPARMFGGTWHMIRNMVRVGVHCNSFLNYREIENYLLTEYHIKS